MNEDLQHRQLRELLGAYALGDLPEPAAIPLRAHLDGCAPCREELDDLAALAQHLAAVDVAGLGRPPATPPADLGRTIREAVAQERQLVELRAGRDRHRQRAARQRRTAALATAACAVLALGVGGGVLLDRPTPPSGGLAAPGVPVEVIELRSVGAGAPAVDRAGLIAHTWGSEVRFEATGFPAGAVFRAAFRTSDGSVLPAGEFVGTGERPLLCNMQSAVLREQAVEFVVVDAAGETVLRSDLA